MPRLPIKLPLLSQGIGRSTLRSASSSVTEPSPRLEDPVKSPPQRVSDKILNWARQGIENGKPHFRVGGTKLYFPKARIILLRPNAKHTPYQAKFIVPKSFNKLDLRDYLFHVYGLRAMNITTQLLHGKFVRANPASPRFRGPQIKKMTIEMMEPFIWPEEPKKEDNRLWDDTLVKDLQKYREEKLRLGSDSFKPGTAFGGAVGPFKPVAQAFVPKFLQKKLVNSKNKYKLKQDRMRALLKLHQICENSDQPRL